MAQMYHNDNGTKGIRLNSSNINSRFVSMFLSRGNPSLLVAPLPCVASFRAQFALVLLVGRSLRGL